MEGEVYFKVRNFGDGIIKFEVVIFDLIVEVLGIFFNVMFWEEEIGVFLEEGEINVKLDNLDEWEVCLELGELLWYFVKEKKLEFLRRVVNEFEVFWK